MVYVNRGRVGLTHFIHGQREHVETEQPIRVQIVQQAPADGYLRIAAIVENATLTMYCFRKKAYSETGPMRAPFSAIVPGTRWR